MTQRGDRLGSDRQIPLGQAEKRCSDSTMPSIYACLGKEMAAHVGAANVQAIAQGDRELSACQKSKELPKGMD